MLLLLLLEMVFSQVLFLYVLEKHMTPRCFGSFGSLGGLIILKFWMRSFETDDLWDILSYSVDILRNLDWTYISFTDVQASSLIFEWRDIKKRIKEKEKKDDGKKDSKGKKLPPKATRAMEKLSALQKHMKGVFMEMIEKAKTEEPLAVPATGGEDESVAAGPPPLAEREDSLFGGPPLMPEDSISLSVDGSGMELDRGVSAMSIDSEASSSLFRDDSAMSIGREDAPPSKEDEEQEQEDHGTPVLGQQIESTPPPSPGRTPPNSPPRDTTAEASNGQESVAPQGTQRVDESVVEMEVMASPPAAPVTTDLPIVPAPAPPSTLKEAPKRRIKEGGVAFGAGAKRQRTIDKDIGEGGGGGMVISAGLSAEAGAPSELPTAREEGKKKVMRADQEGKALCGYKFFDVESVELQDDGGLGGGVMAHRDKGDWRRRVTDERRREAMKLKEVREENEKRMAEVSKASAKHLMLGVDCGID